MSVLVFGRSGQLAKELQRRSDVVALGRDQADLGAPASCEAAIRAHKPNAVINAAAYTDVDGAEREETLATLINGEAPGVMARTCAELEIPLVHLSTDYVFPGNGTEAWKPWDRPAPLNAYGRSKLAGEMAVKAAGSCHVILRTSWVFSAHRRNFVKSMLHLSRSRTSLSVVDDQIGGPTPAAAISRACRMIADQLTDDPAKSGTYHFSGTPFVSWYRFATDIFAMAGRDVSVLPISSSSYPTAATRPGNSRLDCQLTEKVFGLARPDWRSALTDVIHQLEHPT